MKSSLIDERLAQGSLEQVPIFDDDLLVGALVGALVEAIKEFSQLQQCDSVMLTFVKPKYFAQPLCDLFVQVNLGSGFYRSK